jgi:hypothetical protein
MSAFQTWAVSPPVPVPACPEGQDERAHRLRVLADRAKYLASAIEASLRACDARASLTPGSSRARVTSANAKWARAAEDRDRAERNFDEALTAAGYVAA